MILLAALVVTLLLFSIFVLPGFFSPTSVGFYDPKTDKDPGYNTEGAANMCDSTYSMENMDSVISKLKELTDSGKEVFSIYVYDHGATVTDLPDGSPHSGHDWQEWGDEFMISSSGVDYTKWKKIASYISEGGSINLRGCNIVGSNGTPHQNGKNHIQKLADEGQVIVTATDDQVFTQVGQGVMYGNVWAALPNGGQPKRIFESGLPKVKDPKNDWYHAAKHYVDNPE